MSNAEITNERALLGAYTEAITSRIDAFLQSEIDYWKTIDSSIADPLMALSAFFSGGGKRLRPAFCYLGYRAGNSEELSEDIINAGCALELLHNFALVHDDFMDRADTRRGYPTVHKYLENYYNEHDYHGDIEHFSKSVAILAGDFAFAYADRFARKLPERCLEIYDVLKVELFAGQQMDLDAVHHREISKDKISQIAQYKSGKYTIERPLHLGAALTSENAPFKEWTTFGEPLGEAFQLRDDVLGIFGDEVLTGKPVGDDIREGKFTLLIAEAQERASVSDALILSRRGATDITTDEVNHIANIIDTCGALEAVEKKISELYEQAIQARVQLEMTHEVNNFAQYLARYVCWRES